MATRTPPPGIEKAPEVSWTPDAGNVISTVRVQQVCDAFVAVEHPADMAPEALSAALGNRTPELARVDWYDASKTVTVVECVIGVNDPDNTYAEPIAITAADVTPPAPVAIVETFSEGT